MASDLAATLLSNNAPALAADPAMAQLIPQLSLAQAMAQQGVSTAPAYPMQAIGRLAQAFIGGKMMADTTGELAKTYSTAADEASKALPPDHPLQPGLHSSSPYVKMMTLQQVPKAMVLSSGNVEAGMGPGRAVQYEGAKAGAQAGAKAPYEPGGEGTRIVNGVRETFPLTATTRAGMQPGGAPPLSTPPATGPAVAQRSGVTSEPRRNLQPAIPAPPAPVAIPRPALSPTQPASAPATNNQAPGTPNVSAIGGKPLPNPAVEPLVKAHSAEVEKNRESAMLGQQDMATVRMIQDFLPKVKTGWSAETKLEGARILRTMGAPDDKIRGLLEIDPASGQILQKKFLELSSAAARTMGAREPGSVISMFAKAYPGLGTEPEAIKLQTNALYMDRLRAQNLANEKTNYLSKSVNDYQSSGHYRGLEGFNEGFDKNHPPERYLSAAEAMSGRAEPWRRITGTAERNAVISMMPPNSQYLGPDGKMHVTPGGAMGR